MVRFARGVNLCGAEFGQNSLPGIFNTHYTYNSEASFRYFAERNLGLIRLPLRWERLQPILGDALDAQHVDRVKENIAWAVMHGAQVIIDIHNYGRYNESILSAADLADLWARMSREFAGMPGVYAYDIMNEPHDMGSANWRSISQEVVDAIRATGDTQRIMVPGDAWSSAERWRKVNGRTSWINDPADNFVYEAHVYFDADGSGTYVRTYDEELALNPKLPIIGVQRLATFVDWCRKNNVRGYLGEYGVPGDDPRWLTVLDNFLTALDAAGMDGTYWAAGEWWGQYRLSVQPTDDFSEDRPQLSTLKRHTAPEQ